MTVSSSTTHVADSNPINWVERYLPTSVVPYAQLMRLDRPIGWWLLLLPCWWGLMLGQIAMGGGALNLWHAVLFFFGAVAMRGAGCTLNDMADQKFDALVERTKNRPLASGRVSRAQAFLCLVVLSLSGLIVLLQFNWYSVILGASSLLIVSIYPFMKRVTHWPQFVLGLAFNWGALIGWTVTHGSLAPAPLLLYTGGIAWTLAYDTIYAHQDKEDDVLIGVKSTALFFDENTRPWLGGFFAVTIALMGLALWQAHAGLASYIGLAAAALHSAWQTVAFDHTNSNHCLKLFKSNRTFGLLFLAGLLGDILIR